MTLYPRFFSYYRPLLLTLLPLLLLICTAIVWVFHTRKHDIHWGYPAASRIHSAAAAGDVAALRMILDDSPQSLEIPGATLDAKGDDTFQGSPLQFAALNGRPSAVKLLVERGASIDGLAPLTAETPLTLSVNSLDDTEIPRYLISKGAAVNGQGASPLARAVECNATKIAALLISHGANVNAKGKLGRTPLSLAAGAFFDSSDMTNLLLVQGALVDVRSDNGMTPLHYATAAGNSGAVALLLRAGASSNARDNIGRTPLHWLAVAESDNTLAVYSTLKEYGVDTSIRDGGGHTALDIAIQSANASLMRALPRGR